ncbi:MAG TPA: ATP-dependent metallopeptidase FtsH/Yme1/Tma family protein, partial [Anaerolineaceae bacterium]|nr:ATP-dependent metallopeptidase FtsH/Yme1/Tma family protein [Anaerolineaceae bacterium]
MNSRNQSYAIYLLLFIAIIAMVVYNSTRGGASQDVSLNQLAAQVEAGQIARIEVDENRLTITYKRGQQGTSQLPASNQATSNKETGATLVEQLIALGVSPERLSPENIEIAVNAPSAWLGILTALGYILPFIILLGA